MTMGGSQQSALTMAGPSSRNALEPEFGTTDIVDSESGWAIATPGNYIVAIVTGRMDIHGARQMIAVTERQCQEHAKVGYLSLLTKTSSSMMARDVRQTVDEMVQRYTSRYGAAAIVFEGEGFAATFVRSVVTAINLATRASHPNRVFSQVEPALMWLQDTFPGGASSFELQLCLSRLSERLR